MNIKISKKDSAPLRLCVSFFFDLVVILQTPKIAELKLKK